MGNSARRPLSTLTPAEVSLADGTNALQPGRVPGIDISTHQPAATTRSEVIKRLERRIKALKEDVRSRSDYTRLKQKIDQEGGKWRAPNGITFGITKQGWVYQYLPESKNGVARTIIVGLDAEVPFIAVVHTDLQFVAPENRETFLKELEDEVKTRHEPPSIPPIKSVEQVLEAEPESSEIITIIEDDWLSKITMARWGDIEWRQYLKPTQMTLAARAKRGEAFHEDVIYPGDTFEVIAPDGR